MRGFRSAARRAKTEPPELTGRDGGHLASWAGSGDLAVTSHPAPMNYEYVATPEQLRDLADRLRGLPLIAADTEAAGYHRYLDRLSLLQISSREENFLVDPLALDDLSPLQSLFADPTTETVFHDADYDLRILHRDLGWSVHGLWDTQIAAAFLGERSLGLGNVAEKFLGLRLPKAYQRADWAERPLGEGMKEYAATDTIHLPALRDRLREELERGGRLAWAEEEFRLREETRWEPRGDDREAFLRTKGARDLPPRGLAILREVHGWREGVAEERDQAPFRVLPNEALIELSVRPPRTAEALASVRGVGDRLVERRGTEILDAVRRGLEVPEGELPRFPRSPRPERDPELEARIERAKQARNRRAEELGLDPGFLISRALLDEAARAEPTTLEELARVPGVRRWQTEATGDALLSALRAG